jgi:hypothetical protein
VNTGTGKLFFGCLCLSLLVCGVSAAQVSLADISGKAPGYQSVTGEGASIPPGIPGISGNGLLPSRSEVLDEFVDLALDPKNPASSHMILKWAKPSIAVRVSGDPDKESRDCLAGSIAEIRNLTGQTDLKISPMEDPSIEVYFIPLEDFPRRVPGYISGSAGYTRCESRKGFLQKCTVWVPTTGFSDEMGCTILRHEMTHGMGLLGHSEHADSILFQGTTAKGYSPLDREVIRLLYNPALSPGFAEDMVRGYFS